MSVDLSAVMHAFDNAAAYPAVRKSESIPVISVSRTMGSYGTEIAQAVADRLGVRCFGYEILEGIGRQLHASPDLLNRLHEQFGGSGSWLASMFTGDPLDRTDYRQTLALVVHNLQKVGGVLMGRGSHVVLRGDPLALRVRIVAEDHIAATRLAKDFGISTEEALKRVQESNRAREDYMKRIFHESFDAPNAFDLILNTSRMGAREGESTGDIAWAVEAILAVARETWPGLKIKDRAA